MTNNTAKRDHSKVMEEDANVKDPSQSQGSADSKAANDGPTAKKPRKEDAHEASTAAPGDAGEALEYTEGMRSSKILVAGMNGLSNEVCKNLVLAGCGSVTILDGGKVTQEDVGAQFFLQKEDLGKSKAEACRDRVIALNPRVKVHTISEHVTKQSDDFFRQFNIVFLCGADLDTIIRIDEICRNAGIKFWAAGTMGFFGYTFCDHGKHTYYTEKPAPAVNEKKGSDSSQQPSSSKPIRETKEEQYCSLTTAMKKTWESLSAKNFKRRTSPVYFGAMLTLLFQKEHGRLPRPNDTKDEEILLSMRDEFLQKSKVKPEYNVLPDELVRDFARMARTELCPVNAIMGGVIAQEIIRVLSGKDCPFNNFFCFNGLDSSGVIMRVE
ncbi:SUMO-activating enzyme subunit 1 [Quaeritorhiza haematococci]|nr:SUMO-activating enzyme subunit 1 [Quaeritorhiza haematococci]